MMTSHPNTTPLDLSNAVMIGSGTERDCYQHPNNPNLCIKVNNGKVLPNKKQRAKQNQIEYSYYLRLQKRHQQPTVIPQCYGRSEEHTSELQSRENLVCRLLLEKEKLQQIFKYEL